MTRRQLSAAHPARLECASRNGRHSANRLNYSVDIIHLASSALRVTAYLLLTIAVWLSVCPACAAQLTGLCARTVGAASVHALGGACSCVKSIARLRRASLDGRRSRVWAGTWRRVDVHDLNPLFIHALMQYIFYQYHVSHHSTQVHTLSRMALR
jgi:hypothetical protein